MLVLLLVVLVLLLVVVVLLLLLLRPRSLTPRWLDFAQRSERSRLPRVSTMASGAVKEKPPPRPAGE